MQNETKYDVEEDNFRIACAGSSLVTQHKVHRWCIVVGQTLGQQQCFN